MNDILVATLQLHHRVYTTQGMSKLLTYMTQTLKHKIYEMFDSALVVQALSQK